MNQIKGVDSFFLFLLFKLKMKNKKQKKIRKIALARLPCFLQKNNPNKYFLKTVYHA